MRSPGGSGVSFNRDIDISFHSNGVTASLKGDCDVSLFVARHMSVLNNSLLCSPPLRRHAYRQRSIPACCPIYPQTHSVGAGNRKSSLGPLDSP